MERIPSWALKAAVASLGAAFVLALLSRKAKKVEERLVAPPAAAPTAPAAPAATSEEVALQAAKAAGLTGIEAQKAAALAVSGKPQGSADMSLPLEEDIRRRLTQKYAPTYLDIENQGNSCGALKVAVVMVSAAFRGKPRINRQREIQAMLREDLDSGRLHALSLSLKTPEEYQKLMEKQGA
ncbi:unnamed protein product [Effrenium voratum]|nr:unnamed protein product [Effrenium voratum]